MADKQTGRLIVVGDVHGQCEAFVRILHHAGILNDKNEWGGGNSKLLQIGDVIDRGPHALEADALLDRLQESAPQFGGEVIRLVGNHELEVLLGNFSISEFTPEESKFFQQKFKHFILNGRLKAAYAYKGFLITHAGVTRKLMRILHEQMTELSAANVAILLNFIFRESVSHQFYKHPIFDISTSRSGPSRFGGIFWEDINDLVASYTNIPSPFWQICGHTQVAQVATDPKRHLIAIDVGMHRKLEYVEISDKGALTIKTV